MDDCTNRAWANQADLSTDYLGTCINQFLPKAASAKSKNQSLNDAFAAQIVWGEDLFINENLDGHGRTCSSAHRQDNNHTIDPKHIARLHDNNPLFIAETNPELAALEQPLIITPVLFITRKHRCLW